MDKRERIYLCLAKMSDEGIEQKYVKEAFDTNWVVPLGPNVNAFESELSEFVGEGKSVVALSSGTAAMHLALLACGVGPGDEVCVQSFTFCASSNPIVYLGAMPVFIDSESESWNMDPELLELAIKDRIEKTGKKPKAIIPVALYGMPYRIEEIMAVSEKYDIPVIEDAAEGFGSQYKGRMLGTFGRFGVLSFNGNKMITTSGGGALICPNKDAAETIMWYATQAREAYPYYEHVAIGYNYRLSNVCAGIGRGQMTVAQDHIRHHQHIEQMYEDMLKDVKGICVHKQPNGLGYGSNYWLCTVLLSPELLVRGGLGTYTDYETSAIRGAGGAVYIGNNQSSILRPNNNVESMRRILDAAQVESRPVWKPMHVQPIYRSCPSYLNGVSEAIFQQGLCLPSGPCVTDDEVRYIVDVMKDQLDDLD